MRHYDEIDPDEIVKDGETIRCPLFLMDGLQRAVASIDLSDHRAGYRFNDDSRDGRRAVYEEYCARLRDAWKSGKRDDDDDNNDDNENDDPTLSTHRRALSAEPDDAYTAYKKQLENAWRTNPRAATAIERQAEQWRHGK